jgi:hypothetical protein
MSSVSSARGAAVEVSIAGSSVSSLSLTPDPAASRSHHHYCCEGSAAAHVVHLLGIRRHRRIVIAAASQYSPRYPPRWIIRFLPLSVTREACAISTVLGPVMRLRRCLIWTRRLRSRVLSHPLVGQLTRLGYECIEAYFI